MDVTIDFVTISKTNRILIQNITDRMNARGWKIPQLAKATKLSPSGLYGIIDGERWPGSDNLERIAKALDTTPGHLLMEFTENPAATQPTPEEALEIIGKALKERKPSPLLDVSAKVLEKIAGLNESELDDVEALIDAIRSKKPESRVDGGKRKT